MFQLSIGMQALLDALIGEKSPFEIIYYSGDTVTVQAGSVKLALQITAVVGVNPSRLSYRFVDVSDSDNHVQLERGIAVMTVNRRHIEKCELTKRLIGGVHND